MDIVRTQPEQSQVDTPEPSRLTGTDRFVLVLAALGLAGTTLLGNPAAPTREWPAGSWLEYIVRAVSLGYQQPTLRGIEVKTLVVSAISGLLLVWASQRVLRGRVRLLADLPDAQGATSQRVGAATLSLFAVLLLIAWALASTLWSRDAATALGSTWVLSAGWVWAAALALHGHRRLVRPLTDVMLAVVSLAAMLSLWYWQVRATEQRLGWPLGNPLSLASVMVPAVLIAAGRVSEQISLWVRGQRRGWAAGLAALYGGVLVLAAGTLLATGSRGALLAALIGAGVAVWVAVPRDLRVALSLAGVVLAALLVPSGADWLFRAGTMRDASARMRLYAWRDAARLALARPAAGHGAGAFALLSTGLSAQDSVADPLAMSGQVSSDAHCEPLELLADLGVFGGVLGMAAWLFAIGAAAGAARDADRYVAAATAGAVVAALVDASTGVSWRLPGPGPVLAMPIALAWMLWRRPVTDAATVPPRKRWAALIPAVVGTAAAVAGIVDFQAARLLYRGQATMQQAERAAVVRDAKASPEDIQARREQTAALAPYAAQLVDQAARWRMDPPRRLVAALAAGQMRASLAYLPLLEQPAGADAAQAVAVLDRGLAILRRLAAIAPGYADTDWRIAELLNGKAGLAGSADAAAAGRLRRQSLETALQYLGSHPLDRERIWQAMGIWPEIPPAQRLSLLRGTLREEGQVWRQEQASAPAYVLWTQRQAYAGRLWRQLKGEAAGVGGSFMEVGYSSLRQPHSQWQDPLAPEGVRLGAAQLVLAGDPSQATDAMDLAQLLYERAGELLPYSRAAACLDLAACRARQGGTPAWALAAVAQARQILQALPDNPVRRQLQELSGSLASGIQAAGGGYTGQEAEAWWVAVDLFWDMPRRLWPAAIDSWAHKADAALTSRGAIGTVTLELLVARGDAAAAGARIREMLAGGATRTAVETGLRQAGYRWPERQAMVAGLMQAMKTGPESSGPGSRSNPRGER